MSCSARQYSDQMVCKPCGLAWDMNDPHPPECKGSCVKNIVAPVTEYSHLTEQELINLVANHPMPQDPLALELAKRLQSLLDTQGGT